MASDKGSGGAGIASIRDALAKPIEAAQVHQQPTIEEELQSPELPWLPPGCPIEALGKLGQICFFLDEQKQLIALKPQEVNKNHIRNLFGRQSQLCDQYWPRFSDKNDINGDRIITGWKPEIAGDQLMRACAFRGIFDPQGKVRGTGAHRGDNGELILHCGDQVFIAGDPELDGYQEPGFIGGFVYPAGPARPRPDPIEQDTAAGEKVLMMLRAWNWFRELEDPMLLLGFIGCAMIGGALHWRPNAWVTGSTATGKSTLQALIRALFDGGALMTGDATEASLRQLLKQQTLPVFFDELEPDDSGDNRKNMGVIKLARLASSGEQALRGGQNHEGHEFTIRSCFLFSSILLPPMLAQDRNRLAILELDRIPPGKAAPTIDQKELRQLGRELRRRLVDHWHRLDNLIDRYKTALADVGHSGRSADQFGTLLAVADLLLYDAAEEDQILEWANRFRAAELAEKEMDQSDEQEIVQFLASSFLQQRGGDEPRPIVRHIRDAIAPSDTGGNNQAAERLENVGLRVGKLTDAGGLTRASGAKPEELYLAIANSHTALERIFQDRRWSNGTWAQSFARVEGAKRRTKVRFAGAPAQWSTLIPLSAVLDLDLGDG